MKEIYADNKHIVYTLHARVYTVHAEYGRVPLSSLDNLPMLEQGTASNTVQKTPKHSVRLCTHASYKV